MNIKIWLAILISSFACAGTYAIQSSIQMAAWSAPEKPTVVASLIMGMVVALLFQFLFILPISIVVKKFTRFKYTTFIISGTLTWAILVVSFLFTTSDSLFSVSLNTLTFMPPGVALVLVFALLGGLAPNNSFKAAPSGRDVPYRHAP